VKETREEKNKRNEKEEEGCSWVPRGLPRGGMEGVRPVLRAPNVTDLLPFFPATAAIVTSRYTSRWTE
jgi:hypothetical protein